MPNKNKGSAPVEVADTIKFKPSPIHHLVGNSLEGKAKGCAHNDTELRAYINSGTIPNSDCSEITTGNRR